MSNKRKKKKRRSPFIKLFLMLLELVVFGCLVAGVVLYQKTLAKIEHVDLVDSEMGINEDLQTETVVTLKGYTNVACFGLDNRSSGNYEGGNSDAILIVSINNDTGEIRIVSVYRDTYLCIGNGNYKKCNAAYSAGGAQEAVAMLNSNLDLDIDQFVCVDWAAVSEAIDALGGIDIEITDAEMNQINKYLGEVNKMTGHSSPAVTSSGMVHLDGNQGLTYARLRKLSGDDFMRAARQRIVLQAMMKKAKEADLVTLTTLCGSIFDDISTSFTMPELLGLASNISKYEISETGGFPYTLTTKVIPGSGDSVIPVDLTANVVQLHQFLFAEEAYTPSQTVQTINDNIVYKTGISSTSTAIDTSAYEDTVGASGTAEVKENNTASQE